METREALREFYQKLLYNVVFPEDLFGETILGENLDVKLKTLEDVYKSLCRKYQPELFQGDYPSVLIAKDIIKQISMLYVVGKKKLQDGEYGLRKLNSLTTIGSDNIIKTAKRSYCLESEIAQGDISTVYRGHCDDPDNKNSRVVVKVVDDLADNDLALSELRILKFFAENPSEHSKHLPIFLDQFKTDQGQVGMILRQIKAYDLPTIKDAYPNGVPEEHAAWMLERFLSIVGYVHSQGIVHCNIEPTHVMISPKDHNLFLIDWSYAAFRPSQTGAGFKVYNPDFSPPEVKERKPPIPASDLYSVGKTMIYLLGGDPETKTFPETLDNSFKRFLQFFVMESSMQRAQDAWEMYHQWRNLRKRIFGPQKYKEFLV